MRSPIVFALPLLACAACALDTATDSEDLANHSTVEVWITSDPAHAFRHHTGADDADRSLGAPVANVPTIDVVDDAAHQRQEVEGFGAALTDASAALMWKELDGKERSALLEKLISPTKGLGLSMLRLPIAASDSTWNGR